MAPPSTNRRPPFPLRPLRRPLFPSIRPRRTRRPRHHLLPSSLQLTFASPSPQSMTDNDDFWWLHALHAEPPTAWLRALWAEVCKGPIFIEAGKNELEGGADQVFFLDATPEAVMPLSLWMDGAWKLAWIWKAWMLDWIGALGCLATMMDRLD